MSVLINGMEMPTEKNGVVLIIYPNGTVLVEPTFAKRHEGRKEFKAVEIPPHGRLIDADALIHDIRLELLGIEMNGLKGTPAYADDLRTMWMRLADEDLAPTIIEADD